MHDKEARDKSGLAYLQARTAEGFLVTGRDMAMYLYPDSPSWRKRTKARRTGTQNGALGGTMPMLGAKALHRLAKLGLAQEVSDGAWKAISPDGD